MSPTVPWLDSQGYPRCRYCRWNGERGCKKHGPKFERGLCFIGEVDVEKIKHLPEWQRLTAQHPGLKE